MAELNSYLRPKKEDTVIYGKIVSASTEGVVADSRQVYDESLKMRQSEINKKVAEGGFGGGSKTQLVGVPTFTQELLDEYKDQIPDKYIIIPDKENDLQNSAISRQVESNGNYVDILFSAIRTLQSEVARLRNSFVYGINSYTGEDTAMSSVVDGIKDPDDEPLWAIEPEDLSLVASIGEEIQLQPSLNVNTSTYGIYKISKTASWQDDGKIKDIEDGKLFAYTTTTNLNVKYTLSSDSINTVIDLSTIDINQADSYNVMLLISRSDDKYIYISIGDGTRSKIYKEGYYSNGNIYQSKRKCEYDYYISKIEFNNTSLSKLNIYSKYQDFSNQVIPSTPTDQDYKYKVSHITIRSVKTEQVLQKIKNTIQNNELTFVESTKNLWIKNNDKLVKIAAGGGSIDPDDDGMTESEILDLLKQQGIVKEDGGNLSITDLSDITFIHEETGKKYKYTINEDGSLVSQLIPDDSELLQNRIKNSEVKLSNSARGFIGQLRIAEQNKQNPTAKLGVTQNAGLYSDRIKIGAFYAPLSTDKVFGCTRAFIELENTSDSDFCLQGCYLHYTRPTNGKQTVYHLPLTGTIYAGSTYVIAGKQYAYDSDENSYIKVDSFDQEWYDNGQLIDFTIDTESSLGNGFALTYGNSNLGAEDYLYKSNDGSISDFSNTTTYPNLYDPSFIDAVYFYKGVLDASKLGYWSRLVLNIKSNTMYKNTFELDPAQQAYQSCNATDSSRVRWASTNDVWIVDLNEETIKFPHSEQQYKVSNFQPKASYLSKNVCSDKTKLDASKPNMVTCSFGLNLHTDRSFNWISVGCHNEYIWLRKKGETEWTKFESYKEVDQANTETQSYPRRKEYSKEANNCIYARIISRFPADNTQYTSHKCVIKVLQSAPSQPEIWEYVVGRQDASGNIGEYKSDIQTFTLYPTSYKPVIYQTTDQQGFDWLQYQVWAAAANKLYEKIQQDKTSNNIIPIVVNTGDMTQNGTRINEWVDYYNAGKILFKEYEQVNVVGNNDLCGTNVLELGTGDDIGKSNSFYFHVFYCYDIDESTFLPIVNNKYIPSLYYFDSNDFRFIMINSEITMINCSQWYGLTDGDDVVNIYTGWTIGENNRYVGTFTSIYTMIYNMLNTSKKCVTACHEMPFTVITNSSIASGQEKYSRSVGPNNGALIGSHCNQISNSDKGKGSYWLSRLLEYKGVKLMIGGHKHTYACTYPVREYFFFGDGKNSKDNYSEYSMSDTLQNDNVTWVVGDKNYTKFPLTKRSDAGTAPAGFYPYTCDTNLTGGVTYFMCQATGFKLTSNKELPSANQKFSLAIPQTTINNKGKDVANINQQYPMFGIIKLNSSSSDIELVRIANILTSSAKFTQYDYSTGDMKLQYFKQVDGNNYGQWQDSEVTMLSV